MQEGDERFDGWKAIARHLGRDRSTVIRWANERGLPVRAMPGGKSRTVYAIRSELDAWMGRGTSQVPGAPTAEAVAPAPLEPSFPEPNDTERLPTGTSASRHAPQPPRSRDLKILAATAALLIAVPGLYLSVRDQPAGATIEPIRLDPATRARLLQARDDIASRSEPRLRHAVAVLGTIARRYPGHSGIHAALAEGYLLAREFGSLPDALALERARREAQVVLRMDRGSAAALRVLGVVAYWRDRDTRRAGAMFRQAIASDPRDALAHQWYANILADNGEFQSAFREFGLARSLSPGAAYLMTDYAWGLWSAGREREAEAMLSDLATRSPELASVHDCLSVTAFARGDFAGYVRRLKTRADTRGAAELISYAKLADEAVARNDRMLYEAMLTRGLTYAEAMPASDHSWPAFIASVFGDRAELLSILMRAKERDERWGASGYTRRIVAKWKADRAIVEAVGTLVQPAMEPASAALQRFAT